MKKYGRLAILLLSLMLALTTFSLTKGIGFATEEDQGNGNAAGQTVQQEISDPDDTSGDASDNASGDSSQQASDQQATQADEDTDSDTDSNTNSNTVRKGGGDSNLNKDDDADADVPSEKVEPTEPLLKAPTRALPTGDVSNGWKWIVTGEEGDYTLTFVYEGEGTAPEFTVPGNFVANISSQLGDYQQQIKKVVVPERCTAIGTRAFQNLQNLE